MLIKYCFYACFFLFIIASLGLAGFWGYFLYLQNTIPIYGFNFIAIAGVISSSSSCCCKSIAIYFFDKKEEEEKKTPDNQENKKVTRMTKTKAILCFLFMCFSLTLLLQVAISVLILVYSQDHFLYKKSDECDGIFKPVEEVYDHSLNIMCTAYCPCKPINLEVFYYLNTTGYVQGSAKKITECNPCENLGDNFEEYDYRTEQWFLENLGGSVKEICNSAFSFEEKFFDSKAQNYIEFFSQVEKNFNCAGFCTDSKLHIFADINNGLPDSNCATAFIKFFEDMFKTLGIPAIVFHLHK